MAPELARAEGMGHAVGEIENAKFGEGLLGIAQRAFFVEHLEMIADRHATQPHPLVHDGIGHITMEIAIGCGGLSRDRKR